MHIQGMLFQFIRKRLLHIQNHAINARLLIAQLVQHVVDVIDILDRAIKIRREPSHFVCESDDAHIHQTMVIPFIIMAAQFYFEAFQSIVANPVLEEHRVTIDWFIARQFLFLEQVESSD